MATVITNLLSAIPIFGQDIVELIFSTNYYIYFYTCFSELIAELTKNNEIFILNEAVLSILPTIGTINKHALKKGVKIRLNKNEYLSIPYQFIAFLVGLIDGDGYIQITKSTKGFITIKLIISLSLEDISTLEYIHSVLNLGKITKYKKSGRLKPTRSEYCRLTINKTDLQDVIFPLLIHHGIFFLTDTRREQFNRAMFIFKNEVKIYDKIPSNENIPVIFKLPLTAKDYINLNFFRSWLVGFTNAEGSFFIKTNNDGCFQLKQRIHNDLFLAFKLFFNTNRIISIEENKFAQFSVSSKTDIQKVIDFFSFSGVHPLIGLKRIQYLKWLTNLQNSSRYKNLNFPTA